jgi:hypothetical protein
MTWRPTTVGRCVWQTAGSSAVKPNPASVSTDTAMLPDDPAVLKQMIAELLRERCDREGLQQRLDTLLPTCGAHY